VAKAFCDALAVPFSFRDKRSLTTPRRRITLALDLVLSVRKPLGWCVPWTAFLFGSVGSQKARPTKGVALMALRRHRSTT